LSSTAQPSGLSGTRLEAARSDLTFLVYEDERYSFEETWQLAGRVATLLQEEFGIRHGDRVAISMRNYPEWIIAFMAVTSIGGIAVAMNALWTPDEMQYGLSDSGARVLFADSERVARLQSPSPTGRKSTRRSRDYCRPL
jgi:long-chain acyl-CoA synthetase